jgi:predicted transcriptional regulator of viral defense system
MTRQLDFLNTLVADGRTEFTFQDAVHLMAASPPATANALNRLTQTGLVDRVVRGRYALRPLGSLGTTAVSEDLALAVGAAFDGRLHRIAYRSALSEHGLLTHPVRTVYVACEKQVRFSHVSGRPLRVVIERPETIHLEVEPVDHSWRSTLERSLLECAMRVDLAGGVERLAEALARGANTAESVKITKLAHEFGARGLAAERRLASLARALDLPLQLDPLVNTDRPLISLDPRDNSTEWVDSTFRVTWNVTVDELKAVIEN